MLSRVLPLTVLVLAFAAFAAAQPNRPQPNRQEPRNPERLPDDKHESTMPAEMIKKMEIARKEGEHKKVLEDVEKLSDLSHEVASSFGERKQVSTEDVKKLSAIEKLAKRILSGVGGEEVDEKPGAAENIKLADAVVKLNAAAANIKKEMKAETRFVVSASVIANSNEVISLARFIRHSQKPD